LNNIKEVIIENKNRIIMKKIFIFLASISLYADKDDTKHLDSTRDSYFYGSFNLGPAPIPLPGFGIGFRNQHNHTGVDTHLQLTTIGYASQLKYQAAGLYYFKPNLKSQMYTGLGASASYLFGGANLKKGHVIASPEWCFGKTYLNENNQRRYLELQVSFPTFLIDSKKEPKPMYYPLCVFSYGIGF
jgi:hypothetical protein